ncbi:MAG: prolipoprotein diacylglyceryl transferase [Desulfovibrionales bacterium]|nr:prolipoprotein diacylglyceryl transferase [Desulfovibrionales bacterium]
MLQYPIIDPTVFSIGPINVHWYGLMYLFGFLTAWLLGRYRASKPTNRWNGEMVDDLITFCVLGVVLGGRLGYVLFYDLPFYLKHPFEIAAIWNGGMSFHGGLLGVLVCFWLFAKKYTLGFFEIGDFIAPMVPPGLFFGRIGNFINGELWGRTTLAPTGMVFPGAGAYPRHPSQLYEAALEGLLLFLILWIFSSKRRPTRAVSGCFLLFYGMFRFFIEFFREPDAQLGFLAFGWLTMGMLLCVPMILFGCYLLYRAYLKKEYPTM